MENKERIEEFEHEPISVQESVQNELIRIIETDRNGTNGSEVDLNIVESNGETSVITVISMNDVYIPKTA